LVPWVPLVLAGLRVSQEVRALSEYRAGLERLERVEVQDPLDRRGSPEHREVLGDQD